MEPFPEWDEELAEQDSACAYPLSFSAYPLHYRRVGEYALKSNTSSMPIHSTQVVRLDGLMLAASVESGPVRRMNRNVQDMLLTEGP